MHAPRAGLALGPVDFEQRGSGNVSAHVGIAGSGRFCVSASGGSGMSVSVARSLQAHAHRPTWRSIGLTGARCAPQSGVSPLAARRLALRWAIGESS